MLNGHISFFFSEKLLKFTFLINCIGIFCKYVRMYKYAPGPVYRKLNFKICAIRTYCQQYCIKVDDMLTKVSKFNEL